MTFTQELELLRGKEIGLRTPIDEIPCKETSDVSRLCRNPVVSVLMVAYNHEQCISQAIESALEQETDFEYEIVIGEDCSKDRTRDICFEYQRRYPEKIRVLWSDENVFRMCGNGPRVCYRCRGEFLAILEGDDCWIDCRKLQKQVEILRAHPSAGICFGGGIIHSVELGENFKWDGFLFKSGLMKGDVFLNQILFESWRVKRGLTVLTPTVMLRKSALEAARKQYDIFTWNLITLDTLCWAGTAAVSDAYYLEDEIGQYNITPGSASFNPEFNLDGDSLAVKVYFAREALGRTWRQLPFQFRYRFALGLIKRFSGLPSSVQKNDYCDLMCNSEIHKLYFKPSFAIIFISLRFGILRGGWAKFLLRVNGYCAKLRMIWSNFGCD